MGDLGGHAGFLFVQDWVPLCFSAAGSACFSSHAKLSLTRLFLSLLISAVLAFPLVNVPFAFTYHEYFKIGSDLPSIWARGREAMLAMVPEPCQRAQL